MKWLKWFPHGARKVLAKQALIGWANGFDRMIKDFAWLVAFRKQQVLTVIAWSDWLRLPIHDTSKDNPPPCGPSYSGCNSGRQWAIWDGICPAIASNSKQQIHKGKNCSRTCHICHWSTVWKLIYKTLLAEQDDTSDCGKGSTCTAGRLTRLHVRHICPGPGLLWPQMPWDRENMGK